MFVTTWLRFVLAWLACGLATRLAATADLVRSGSTLGWPGPPASLPWLLGEEALVGLLLACPVAGLSVAAARGRSRWLRPAGLGLTGLLFAWPVLDQAAYEFVFAHLDWRLWQESGGDLGALGSSLRAALDPLAAALAGLALGATGWVWWPGSGPAWLARLAAARWRRRLPYLLPLAVVYLLAGVWLARSAEQYGLQRSAWTVALGSLLPLAELPEPQRALAPGPETSPPDTGGPLLFGPPAPTEDLAELWARRGPLPPGQVPSVVVYIGESLAYAESSLPPGARWDTTPFLAELAGRCLSFTDYSCAYPASTRSDFSLLSGRYPWVEGSSDVARHAHAPLQTLLEVLHQRGWATAVFTSSDSQFESFDGFLGQHPLDELTDLNRLDDAERDRLLAMSWGIEEEPMIDRALDWIAHRRAERRPFLLLYKATFPHHPYEVPPGGRRFLQQDWAPNRGRYQASLAYGDAMVRRFWDGLRTLGAGDETLFVFTADHGEAFADRHPRNGIHGQFVYQENVHVPLLLCDPRLGGQGRRIGRPGNTLDFTPTLLDWLGLDAAGQFPGQSLLAAGYRERLRYLFSYGHFGLRDGPYKFILDRTDLDRMQLYDLRHDPDEREDLSDRHPARLARYRARLLGWLAANRRSFAELQRRTGESEAVRAQRLAERRRQLFGPPQDRIAALALCELAAPAAPPHCLAPDQPRTAGQRPLALRVRWSRPGTQFGTAELFDPSGQRAELQRLYLPGTGEASLLKFGGVRPPLRPGRWRVEIQSGGPVHRLDFRVDG